MPAMPLLPRPVELLLGLCAALGRAPAYARSAVFATQVTRWWVSPDDPISAAPRLADSAGSDHPAAPVSTDSTAPAASAQADEAVGLLPALPAAATTSSEANRRAEPATQDVIFGDRAPLRVDGLPTALGGVLYLIHLLAWLDLPAVWDSRISGWAVIEMLARELLRAHTEIDTKDQLWSVLAALDGRTPGTLPGADLDINPDFRLPPGWLRFLRQKEIPVGILVNENRLLIYAAEADFVLMDVTLDGESPDLLIEQAVEAYHQAGIRLHQLETGVDPARLPDRFRTPAAGRWMAYAAAFIRQWLSDWLDITPESLVPTLLCKSGHLAVSHTHIDLYLAMDAADIRVRRTGLDRNPGWMPDLGYIVLFHFLEG
jgi:hypothetical protein